MKTLAQVMTEATPNDFSSMTAAIDFALAGASKLGYDTDEDERFDVIAMGPKKPSPGKTVRYTLTLYKKGVQQKKALHIQIYGKEKTYELNTYIL